MPSTRTSCASEPPAPATTHSYLFARLTLRLSCGARAPQRLRHRPPARRLLQPVVRRRSTYFGSRWIATRMHFMRSGGPVRLPTTTSVPQSGGVATPAPDETPRPVNPSSDIVTCVVYHASGEEYRPKRS